MMIVFKMVRAHYFYIKVIKSHQMPPVESLAWRDLPWPVRLKWDWYFKYRAALLQVKYPRFRVEASWGNYEVKPDHLVYEQTIRNRIIAKKRKITEFKNNLDRAVKTWDSLFPIEDDPTYIKCMAKLDRLKNELTELETIKL